LYWRPRRDIVLGAHAHARHVVLAHLAHRLGRRAEDHRAVGRKLLFSMMTAPAPTRQSLPITELLSTTAWMPINVPSPIVQPCSIDWWPTVTPLPSVSGNPGSGVQDAVLLDVGVVADHDRLVVAAHHRAGHDGHPLAPRSPIR